MRKVTTINLNGRAYQLEDAAYEKLQTYLHRSEATLAGDPDRQEVMSDIEQAIADKCEHVLAPGKNVVSAEQIVEILDQMGEVEAGDGATEPKTDKAKDKTADDASRNSKRLFLVREGSMLMGVCQGLGAYFGVDANLLRVAFVLLTIFTSGFWVLLYFLLAIVLPTAKSEADLAEAYGKPMTAQDIVERARERAPDSEALKRFSDAAIRILRIGIKIAAVLAFTAFGVLTAVWVWTQSQLIAGNLQLQGQLASLNGWRQWVAVTAAYAIVAIPVLGIARICNRYAEERQQSTTPARIAGETSLGVLWGLSVVAIVMLTSAYGHDFVDYARQHQGYIDVGDTSICVDGNLCSTNYNR